MRLRAFALVLVAAAIGCGDDMPNDPDAAAPDAIVPPDTNAFDGPIDAFVPCFGQVLFTGEYVDWDSTKASFLGIPDATATDMGNPGNTATTAPNGRVILCLTPGQTSYDVSYTHTSYLPMMFSADADVLALGPFATRGLTPTRATALAGELGVAAFTGTQLLVEVANVATQTPLAGISLDLPNNTFEKVFAVDAAGVWTESAQTGTGGYLLFTNVQNDGDGMLSITGTGGLVCQGRAVVSLIADGLTATTFHCE